MATITANVLPADVTITNTSSRARVIQLFGRNIRAKLAPADILLLRVTTSEQSLYYQSLAGDGITVGVAAVDTAE